MTRFQIDVPAVALACLAFASIAFAKPPVEAPHETSAEPSNDLDLYESLELAGRRGIQRAEAPSPDDEYAFEYYTFTQGTSYNYRVTVKQLQAAPLWKKDADHPPLPARKAIRLARDFRKKTVTAMKDYKWTFESAKLFPVEEKANQWIWIVRFEEWPQFGGLRGEPDEFEVVVLMDGTIVQPEETVVHKAGYGFF